MTGRRFGESAGRWVAMEGIDEGGRNLTGEKVIRL
jgi:hypothetical protein